MPKKSKRRSGASYRRRIRQLQRREFFLPRPWGGTAEIRKKEKAAGVTGPGSLSHAAHVARGARKRFKKLRKKSIWPASTRFWEMADGLCHVITPADYAAVWLFTKWRVDQLESIARGFSEAPFALTLMIERVLIGGLSKLGLDLVKARVRRWFDRFGLRSCVAIGILEVEFDPKIDAWKLHLHAIIFGTSDKGRAEFRKYLPANDFERPVVWQLVRDFDAQARYAGKFTRFNRPGAVGKYRRQAMPLPKDRFLEIMRFYARYRFTDFMVAYGARLSGRDLKPAPKGVPTIPTESEGKVSRRLGKKRSIINCKL